MPPPLQMVCDLFSLTHPQLALLTHVWQFPSPSMSLRPLYGVVWEWYKKRIAHWMKGNAHYELPSINLLPQIFFSFNIIQGTPVPKEFMVCVLFLQTIHTPLVATEITGRHNQRELSKGFKLLLNNICSLKNTGIYKNANCWDFNFLL